MTATEGDTSVSIPSFKDRSSAAPAAAAPGGSDYYSRNQYHVHGAYSKPSGPAYDSSGYVTASYGSAQVHHLSDMHQS